jgi:protein-L-isoaspartate(D-aspartate) O-methyltransferase
MGYKARFFLGDGSRGIEGRAPYDKIIVTAGAPTVPDVLLAQLNVGGIMVIPVGDENSQKMVTILKTGENSYEKHELDTFRFVPLIGDKAW